LPRATVAPAGTKPTGQAEQFTLQGPLRRRDLIADDPTRQFAAWFADAQTSGRVAHPETACLATAELPSGRVAGRVVYLKEVEAAGSAEAAAAAAAADDAAASSSSSSDPDAGGGDYDDAVGAFVVYTNVGSSRKAADLATNPHAALTFWWEG